MASPGFLWGVATASYQIEGAIHADGRLPSIWDTFSATPGKTLGGDSGEHACEHYTRWAEDVDLIADLGVDGYRLSIAWPRVMHADGTPNAAGLDFYRRLLTRLGERGIRRFVTLYHWDLPQHLEDRGGWLNRDTAWRFADYAALVARELRGLVDGWMTLNEPWCSAFLGYGNGHHAPGLADPRYATQAMHHLLLGHGLGLQAIREHDPGTPAGIVANVGRGTTDSSDPADIEAARLYELQHNDWVLQPLLAGRYPADLFERLWPGSAPLVLPGDMDLIRQPLDFLGINYYFRSNLRSDGATGFRDVPLDGVERTQMGWEVYPQGLEDLLRRFKAVYPNLPPVYITENGMASDDAVVDGRVDDPQRQSYLKRHFAAVSAAMDAGVEVRGYFVWSLMDNFEWAFGYERRFGLVHVDYTTQARTLKDSALAFRTFLQQRRAAALPAALTT
ncbi:GH1 family beta-glucosidase [Sphaerotilus sp.]|uniref:GH1 family beta-glucosidase n=1 Tax=Sphaerotilus sp. TaxID=2093942 RepID=UPI002ACE2446|nr:GH1 family beta-glucosidase [Sphaerotilus sp.]MDZ7857965.1 GH1 family beta-glucosidase [Sphaerotilus sp.]